MLAGRLLGVSLPAWRPLRAGLYACTPRGGAPSATTVGYKLLSLTQTDATNAVQAKRKVKSRQKINVGTMNEQQALKKIQETLLHLATDYQASECIFMEIDTSVSNTNKKEIVPYLNLYAHSKPNTNMRLDEFINTAIDQQDLGYMFDHIDLIFSSSFEMNLESVYPHWPEATEAGDEKIINALQESLAQHKEKFQAVKKIYFYYLGSFEFVKLKDEPA
ncbi:MAG: hypothetical protein MUF42_17670 [Cytophagaceae bacterium]|jgi:hypothetical protein|nr:hypothetical protein [Cytophagaceae bacterium]